MAGINRPLVPDGVIVGQSELRTLTDAIADEVLRRLGELTGRRQPGPGNTATGLLAGGITSGFAVVVGTTTTRVTINVGTGYAPNGAYFDVTAAQPNLALADPTLNADNYVGLMYREVEDQAGAHETSGTAQYRRAQRSFEAMVVTPDTYDAWVLSSTDLAVNARDRFLILFDVLGLGTGIALGAAGAAPLGNAPPTFGRLLTANQPVNITGVEIVAIDPATVDTPASPTGQLRLNVAAPQTISWASPGGGTHPAGTAVGALEGALLVLTSAVTSRTLTVRVFPSLLPTSGADPLNETITVAGLLNYEPTARRLTTVDEAHRHVAGGYVPSNANAHGLSPLEVIAAVLGVPQTIRLGTGLGSLLAQAAVPRLQGQTWATGDRILVYDQPLRDTTIHVRVFAGRSVAAVSQLEITTNANYLSTGNWRKDDGAVTAVRLTIDSSDLRLQYKTGAGDWPELSWTNRAYFTYALNRLTLEGQLVPGNGLLGSDTDALTARTLVDYSTAFSDRVLLAEYDRAIGYRIRIYLNDATDAIETTWNARWQQSDIKWYRDVAGSSARVATTAGSEQRLYYPAGDPDGWLELAWYSKATFPLAAGDHEINNGDLVLNAAYDYTYDAARTFQKSVPGIAAQPGAAAYTDYAYSGGAAGNPEGGPVYFQKTGATGQVQAMWPVELPHGAIITGVDFDFEIVAGTGGAEYFRVAMCRQPRVAGNAESLKTGGTPYDSVGNAANFTQTLTIDEVVATRTIDNASYTYFAWMSATTAASGRVRSVIITYTIDTIRPA